MTRSSKKQTTPAERLRRLASNEQLMHAALRSHWSGPASHFDRLAHRTDPARIEPLDVIAISALGAAMPVAGSAWIVGELGQWLTTEILADIPIDVGLAKADVAVIHRVADLYNLLRTDAGLTRSATTRLLAAKRPSLVPIDDAAARKALRYSKTNAWWQHWREAVTDDVEDRVASIRAAAADDVAEAASMSTMRVLDTTIKLSVA